MKSRFTILESGAPQERADALANRRKILRAARRLIARKGGDFSMDELAELAKVGKGTLYRRFQDKTALCLAMLDDEAAELQAEILHGKGADDSLPVAERILWLVERLIRFQWPHAAVLSQVSHGRESKFEHPGYRWQVEALEMLLREGDERGQLRSEPTYPLALALLALIDPPILLEYERAGYTPDDAVEMVLSLVRPILDSRSKTI